MNAGLLSLRFPLVITALVFSTPAATGFCDPSIGRWIQRDPIAEPGAAKLRYSRARWFEDASEPSVAAISSRVKYFQQNLKKPLYTFVLNNPADRIDPVGLDSPGCDGVPGFVESACLLECCAEHDQCFRDHHCTARSWLLIWCPWSRCGGCNRSVISCALGCIGDSTDDPNRPNYYCGLHDYWFDDPNDPHMNHSTN